MSCFLDEEAFEDEDEPCSPDGSSVPSEDEEGTTLSFHSQEEGLGFPAETQDSVCSPLSSFTSSLRVRSSASFASAAPVVPVEEEGSESSAALTQIEPSPPPLGGRDAPPPPRGGAGLHEEQERVLHDVVFNHPAANFFVSGPAGTGKTRLLQRIHAALSAQPDRAVLLTASTAVAACGIGGTTLHAALHIGRASLSPQKLLARFLRLPDEERRLFLQTTDIIVDEISIIAADLFQKIYDYLLLVWERFPLGDDDGDLKGRKRSKKKSRPRPLPRFILFGDFYQLPPVPSNSSGSNEAAPFQRRAEFCFKSAAWKELRFRCELLTVVHRQEDPLFRQVLSRVRTAQLTLEDVAFLRRLERPWPPERGQQPTQLLSKKAEVELANKANLKLLIDRARSCGDPSAKALAPQPRFAYFKLRRRRKSKGERYAKFEEIPGGSRSLGSQSDEVQRTFAELEDAVRRDCAADVPLYVFPHVRVMCVVNLDLELGLTNGAQGHVHSYDERSGALTVQLDAHPRGQLTAIKPYTWRLQSGDGQFEIRMTTLPLRLAAAVTIHKAQGATLDCPVTTRIDMGSMFEPGMAYVALSRATRADHIHLTKFDERAIYAHQDVRFFYASLEKMNHEWEQHPVERRGFPSSSSSSSSEEEEEEEQVDEPKTKTTRQPKRSEKRRRKRVEDLQLRGIMDVDVEDREDRPPGDEWVNRHHRKRKKEDQRRSPSTGSRRQAEPESKRHRALPIHPLWMEEYNAKQRKPPISTLEYIMRLAKKAEAK